MNDDRKVQKYINDNWVDCDFADLEINDIFRLFDYEVPVIDIYGKTVWKVSSDIKTKEDGTPYVYCDSIE